MDTRYVTLLLSGPRLKKGPFALFHGQAVYSESGVRYAASRFIKFHKEGVITERKTYQGRCHSSRIIFGQFIPCSSWHFSVKMTILWKKQKLCHEKKIQWKWNKLEESDNTSNSRTTTWVVKENKMPHLGPFTGNAGVKRIPSDPTEEWWITELFSETPSLRCYARRITCIIFKIKENRIAVLRCWNGWMSVSFMQLTKKGVKPGISASSA
jgi:hypothetical protein